MTLSPVFRLSKTVITQTHQFTILPENEELPPHIQNLAVPLLLSLRISPKSNGLSSNSHTVDDEFVIVFLFHVQSF